MPAGSRRPDRCGHPVEDLIGVARSVGVTVRRNEVPSRQRQAPPSDGWRAAPPHWRRADLVHSEPSDIGADLGDGHGSPPLAAPLGGSSRQASDHDGARSAPSPHRSATPDKVRIRALMVRGPIPIAGQAPATARLEARWANFRAFGDDLRRRRLTDSGAPGALDQVPSRAARAPGGFLWRNHRNGPLSTTPMAPCLDGATDDSWRRGRRRKFRDPGSTPPPS